MAIKIGFTGTRRGLTTNQKAKLRKLLSENFVAGAEFHHGDCVGADAWAAANADRFGYTTFAYPGDITPLRAFHKSDVIYAAAPCISRNHAIVRRVDKMIACPGEDKEVLRSGTWATIRYAKKMKNKITVIKP